MVLSMKYVLLLAAVIAVNIIFAQERDPPPPGEDHNGDGPGNSRCSFSRYVRCNSTSQAGRTCASCRQTLLCLSNNVGILRTCRGLRRYCNQGRCSFVGGSACNGTSSG